jgi:hypothetical protein
VSLAGALAWWGSPASLAGALAWWADREGEIEEEESLRGRSGVG